ncbi:MAG: hypothetical protein KA419_08060 [Acidobacteria bacterium]|nr:hypothetical protein [Acidobacteriota bacterium]
MLRTLEKRENGVRVGRGLKAGRRGRDLGGDSDPVRCARCRSEVTRRSAARAVDGALVHTFANPHGIVFRIATYAEAPGAVGVGGEHAEFTWFAGRTWRIALCGSCLAHLGWSFHAGAERFWGLILDRLSEPPPGSV